MSSNSRKTGPARLAAPAVVVALLTACVSPLFIYDTTTKPADFTAFRIENATAGMIDMTMEILSQDGIPLNEVEQPVVQIPVITVTPDNVSYSTLQPIGASAANQETQTGGGTQGSIQIDGAAATVRVPAGTASDGALLCGAIIRLTATSDGSEASLVLSGSGSGTPLFDSGSEGLTGERFLIQGLDFDCGQEVIVRIDPAASAESAPTGRVAVVNLGAASPFGPVESGDDGGTGGDGGDGGDGATEVQTVDVQVQNATSVISDVSLEFTNTAGETQTYDVSVFPEVLTTGQFECASGTQLLVAATLVNNESTSEVDLPDATVVLTGDGTGSSSFDKESISANGERILVEGTHFDCDQTIFVRIEDDSAVATPNGFNSQGTGGGMVFVLDQGESPPELDDSGDAGGTPDMDVVVVNQTDEFMKVNFGTGATGVGQSLDIFVPPNGQSEGATGCSSQMIVRAVTQVQNPTSGLEDLRLVVLGGTGTGTVGFDAGSVGETGERRLLLGEHYICGSRITVTITDPGSPMIDEPDTLNDEGAIVGFEDLNGNGIQDTVPEELGEGTVTVQ